MNDRDAKPVVNSSAARVRALAALVALACSGCSESPRPDDAPSSAQDTSAAYHPRPTGTLTFTRDVAPIVFEHCAPCHRPGGTGPFDLLSYQDVASRSADVAEVTGSRFMPPWLPRPGTRPLLGERRLAPDQIGVIAQWAAEGAPRGAASDLPPPPRWSDGWQLGSPDLVAQMPEPFVLAAEGRDVYRNIVIPIPTSTTRFVQAVELRPDDPKLIHHATMWIDRTGTSRRVDLEDPEPGYPSMDPRGNVEDPDGHFLGWTPGSTPWAGREDIAWRLDPGTDLVLQLHMVPTGKPEHVRCRIGFYFAERAPERVATILWLGSKTIEIPAGEASYRLEDAYVLPVPVEILAFRPHAHYLATGMEAQATLPNAETYSSSTCPGISTGSRSTASASRYTSLRGPRSR